MGNDYDSRRQNKRLNKKAGREAAEKGDAKDKRKRTKGRAKVGPERTSSSGVPRASHGQCADLQVSMAWQGREHGKPPATAASDGGYAYHSAVCISADTTTVPWAVLRGARHHGGRRRVAGIG